jgi:pyrrolysine biosynthesis protein PylC
VKLLIVGGKLQGTEAVYLAQKAGWETVLVDRRDAPPASGLADRHVVADVTADETVTRSLVRSCDAVLPACEDLATLEWLAARVPGWDVPLLFDIDAYRVSSSKKASSRLFAELDVPRPVPWPECDFPVVVKPDTASGSEGVTIVHDEEALSAAAARLEAAGHSAPVIEEYVAGPSLSIEVLAWNGRAVPLQVTGLEFDEVYDCRRVVAPVGESHESGTAALAAGGACDWQRAVPRGTSSVLGTVGCRIAEGLGLRGLMDVEVMVSGSLPKLLEIDARMPSQTPTVVLWSSGLNILELLYRTVADGAPPEVGVASRRACVYEHVYAHDGRLEIVGEHVMGSAAPLRLVPGFCGADEAVTDYRPGGASWSATLIVAADDVAQAQASAADVVGELARMENLQVAPEPEMYAEGEVTGR